jgi:hypothetical protein
MMMIKVISWAGHSTDEIIYIILVGEPERKI